MFTIAFIGFGNSVIRYHLPYLRKRNNIRVKVIYRKTENRSDRERELLYPDINFTSDIKDIIQDDEIDLVSVNTPNQFHYAYAKKLLLAGKNVLVEKPFMEVHEAIEIFALAKSKGLFISVNQNRRYDVDFLSLKQALMSKKMGEILIIESHYDYFDQWPSVHEYVLRDIGIHLIDQAVSLFGAPISVDYDVRKTINSNTADDFFDLNLHYGEFNYRIKVSLFVKLAYPRFIVHGKNGSFLKNSQGHVYNLQTEEPVEVNLIQEPASNWGHLSYCVDSLNYDEYIESETSDYGRIYDDAIATIKDKKPKTIKDEEVLEVLNIIKHAPQV